MARPTAVEIQDEAARRMPRMIGTKATNKMQDRLLLMDRLDPDRPRLAKELARAKEDQCRWDRCREWALRELGAKLQPGGATGREPVPDLVKIDVTGRLLRSWTLEQVWTSYLEANPSASGGK